MLRMAGADESEAVADAILRHRDEALAGGAGRSAALDECPLCMERYVEEESGMRVPRILQCGHSACHGCFAQMLRPIAAEGNFKRLECPVCREATEVRRGQAGNLPKNFGLLR